MVIAGFRRSARLHGDSPPWPRQRGENTVYDIHKLTICAGPYISPLNHNFSWVGERHDKRNRSTVAHNLKTLGSHN